MTINIHQLKDRLATKDHIIGKDRYKITAVLLPLIEIEDECRLVFQVRSKNIPQAGEVCFPGGKFDESVDNNTQDTAIRETMEEMGLYRNQIEYIGQLGHYIAPMGVLVDAYVGKIKVKHLRDINFNKHEVESIFALPVEKLKNSPPQIYNVAISVDPYTNKNGKKELLLPFKKLGLPKRYEKPWGNINHRIFVWENEPVIWGITAELIKEFIDTI